MNINEIIEPKKKKSAVRIKNDDYIYLSAMLSTRAIKRPDRNALLRLADARDVDEMIRMLPEYSVEPKYDENSHFDADLTVNEYLAGEFRTVGSLMPDAELVDLVRAEYDCHNIKTVIKAGIRGKEPEGLFIDLGRIPVSRLRAALSDKDESVIGRAFLDAAEKASVLYAETGDPKHIDSLLDEAYFDEMARISSQYRNEFFGKLVSVKADTTNIITAFRILRMKDNTGLMKNMFINGGKLGVRFFTEAMAGGEEGLVNALSHNEYSLPASVAENFSLTALSRYYESVYLRYFSGAKEIPFGAENCVAYLIRAVYSAKMIRMIVALKRTGASPEKIRESIGNF